MFAKKSSLSGKVSQNILGPGIPIKIPISVIHFALNLSQCEMPSRLHFSTCAVKMNEAGKARLCEELSEAQFFALMMDSWTLQATETSAAVTEDPVTDICQNKVLQTRRI